jgi:ADP-heptose:LPS heptosyltransferase
LLFAGKLAPLKRLRAGLCLFGNPNRSDDWARSVALQDIAALTQLQQVDWINLSVDARPEREGLKGLLPGLVDVTSDMKDFKATAGLIANLDVVISIDSVIAHLAAALGKPVLLLCPTIADWRWKIGQVDSPWWPTVEVFKSAEAGNFALAMHAVARRIDALAASRR